MVAPWKLGALNKVVSSVTSTQVDEEKYGAPEPSSSTTTACLPSDSAPRAQTGARSRYRLEMCSARTPSGLRCRKYSASASFVSR